ncbi:olfactory receptor 1500-like [Bufo bufo]|uniref:olfactory receptor 1500-like n=1 Tax=Bufo bufo TaxID=8384 RepID=UPI001ABDF7F1|nr:olfactory receptor 1500-like [Bufo bufo]
MVEHYTELRVTVHLASYEEFHALSMIVANQTLTLERHMPGSKNVKADALSRSFCAFQPPDTPPEPVLPPNIIVAALSSDLATAIETVQYRVLAQIPSDKLFVPGHFCLRLLDDVKSYVSGCEIENLTNFKEFFLLGFQGSLLLRIVLFCLFFVVFWVTVCGNLLTITLVSTSINLNTPMYFFISQLSISDIMLTSDITPKMLHTLLNHGETITLIGCMTQVFFFCAIETSECLLLTVMSYDRYVAICKPLRYSSIMTNTYCVTLVVFFWSVSFFMAFIDILTLSRLYFCELNVIDHLFCDILPLLKLSCSDTFPMKLQMSLLCIPFLIIPSIIIVVSYVNIARAILQIPSNISRQKAFSTCSSHLIVVSIFYWTIFSIYILPTNGTSDMNKILSLLYTVFTPLVNPIIYSLRNKDIKKAVQDTIQKYV